MKWILAILIALSVFVPAAAEEEYDTFYTLEYTWSGLEEEWGARETIEQEDMLLSLYCEAHPADAVVYVRPIDTDESVMEYLNHRIEEEGSEVLLRNVGQPTEWVSSWGAMGAQVEYSYYYVSGGYISSSYCRKIYIAPYGGEVYLEFVVTVENDNQSGMIEVFEEHFLRKPMSLHETRYTEKVNAYLEEVEYTDGTLILSLDTYIKEGGNEMHEATIYNNDPSLIKYRLSEDAHVWIASPDKVLGWKKVEPDAAQLSMLVSEYVLTNKEFPPFVFYIDGNEIVWMEQTIEAT